MPSGLVTYKANGLVDIDTSTISFNVVDSFVVAANATVTRSYPNLSDMTLYATATSAAIFQANEIPTPHTINIAGTTVTASGGNIAQLVMVLAK